MFGALLALSACGDDDGDDSAVHEEQVQADCPSDLTYERSAAPVLKAYCETCHSEKSAAKLGANTVITDEAAIRTHGKGLYELVEGGQMPMAGGPIPAQLKTDFLDWMECSGAAASGHNHDHE
jgi:hypothetical protein